MNFFFLPEIEKRILNFWKNFNIFEKSLEKNKKNKKFVWIEGPPYTNAPPHIGHFLTRIYKDSILRFFTMLGYYVPRKAGWDTHGLPIEVATEKSLGFKNKKEILDYGIDKFNTKCKELVTAYKNVWEELDKKIGFWINHKNSYITFDPFYIESCWWIIKQIYQNGYLKQDNKVAPYCPRCETVLAQAELGMPDAYKEVEDPSIYVKFKIKNKNYQLKSALNDARKSMENEYFLVWTTTPWTLPGNLALAIHPDLDYYLYKTEKGKVWTHQRLDYKILDQKKGRELAGIEYEPLFKLTDIYRLLTDNNSFNNQHKSMENNQHQSTLYKTYLANFIKEDEGTGIVHIAPAYGEEDFKLGKKENLGVLNYLNEKGEFIEGIIKDLDLNGKFFKDVNPIIIEYLKLKNLLFREEKYLHDYPHCWRCKSPLIYYTTKFWIIEVSKIKNKIIENNKKVNWIPETAGNRFYEWIKEGKDWNLSRTRFWGIPLPIWICNKCYKNKIIGSLEELSKNFKSNNNYFLMRHCESLSIKKNYLSSYPEVAFNPLTRKGVLDAKRKAKSLKNHKIDLIYASPLLRTKETALIIADSLGVPVFFDDRLREIDMGILNGQSYNKLDEYLNDKLTNTPDFNKRIENGESLNEVRKRITQFLLELERIHRSKNILIISHGGPLWLLECEMKALSQEQTKNYPKRHYQLGEIRKIDLLIIPRDDNDEINLHRPFVDNFSWQCKCGGWYKRTSEIVDIWFDSGCVPFASHHYPFENKKEIDSGKIFPLDFIIEGIDQTRGWFYSLLVISTLIKEKNPYKNVLVSGLVLDEKGIKMSKSLGNVINPIDIIENYGADLPRFYFFYLNNLGDDKRFSFNEMLQLKREFFDLLMNIYNFYKTYNPNYKKDFLIKNKNFKVSKNVLDFWFNAQLKKSYENYYNEMIKFNLHKSSRIIVELLSDFSRWWLRRSRERFQNPQNKEELISAILNFEDFLYQFLKMLAPLAPFTAEYFYQEIKDDLNLRFSLKESIHLETLGKPIKLIMKEKLLLEEMEKIRNLASNIHQQRKEKGIKVRQPLKLLILKTKFSPEVLKILKNEINVLEIKVNSEIKEEFILDFEITEELKEIGILNDFIRFIQDLRKEAQLIPKQIVGLKIEAPKILNNIFKKYIKELLKQTKTELRKISKTIIVEKEFNYENFGKTRIILYR